MKNIAKILVVVVMVIILFLSFSMSVFADTLNDLNSSNIIQEENSNILVKVKRDGKVKQINIKDVVVEDIVILESGDLVPADGIIKNGGISLNESNLNGALNNDIVIIEEIKEFLPKVNRKAGRSEVAPYNRWAKVGTPLRGVRLHLLKKYP